MISAEISQKVQRERERERIFYKKRKTRANCVGVILHVNCLLKSIIEGKLMARI